VLPADQSDTAGTQAPVAGRERDSTEPNVVVSGWQTYDNKGQVVEKFEPFFSQGFAYLSPEDEQALFGRNVLGQKVTMFYDPRGQVIRTVSPDGSEQRVIYGVPGTISNPDLSDPDVFEPTPWEAYTNDANDNAGRTHPNDPRLDRIRHHLDTPAHIVVDALGRTVLAVERNRDAPANPGDPLPPIEEIRTVSTYDIRGNLLIVTDALGRKAFRYAYDLANNPLRIENLDAGLRRIVVDAAGNEIERRDSKDALILQGYDLLHRPLRLWARDDGQSDVTLRERLIYGDSAGTGLSEAEAQAANLRGQLHQHFDEAGRLIFERYDFKGNVLEKARQVIRDEKILEVFPRPGEPSPDWQIQPFRVDWQEPASTTLEGHAATLLNPFEYRTSATYDALDRVKVMHYPRDADGQRKELQPKYNRAGALEQVTLVPDAANEDTYVEHIAYNARGQRTLIALGNGLMTRYAYDPQTFHLARLRSEAFNQSDAATYQPAGKLLQDFAYEYDLVGNILAIHDRAPGSGVPAQPDALARIFEYDAIYRLVSATGREHATNNTGFPWDERPHSQDITATQPYTETYLYDPVGNMLELRHTAGVPGNVGGFTRDFTLRPGTNQLERLTIGSNPNSPFTYTYDDNGNMISETTSRHFEWEHSDQMKVFRNQMNSSEPSVHAHYLYDAGGQRVKKLVRKQGGSFETTVYMDELFEHHRWGNAQNEQNNQLHVMDDQQRVAMVRVGDPHPEDKGPRVQYHLGDHLGSSNLVVDEQAIFISREEYMPYGETSFGSFGRKRYRFTGKERDEESGLNYHSLRYYAVGLGRWISADPAGARDGQNLYTYNRQNPVRFVDPAGTDSKDKIINAYSSEKAKQANLSREADRLTNIVRSREHAIDRAFKALEALDPSGRSVKALDKEINRLSNIIDKAHKEFTEAKTNLSKIQGELSKSHTKLNKLEKKMARHDIDVKRLEKNLEALKRQGGFATPRALGGTLLGAAFLYLDYRQIASQDTLGGQAKEASAFAGRLLGAALGAKYGTWAGPWGIAAGAFLGALIGESGIRAVTSAAESAWNFIAGDRVSILKGVAEQIRSATSNSPGNSMPSPPLNPLSVPIEEVDELLPLGKYQRLIKLDPEAGTVNVAIPF
jgi:RHS repeat-associated protein